MNEKSQSNKFRGLARDLDCDETEEVFDDALRVILDSPRNRGGGTDDDETSEVDR